MGLTTVALGEVVDPTDSLNPQCRDCPVRQTAFCAKLCQATQKRYRDEVTLLQVAKDTLIRSRAAPHDRLLILTEGVVRLTRSLHSGNRQVLAFFFAGDLISYGDRAAAWDGDLEAVTACRLCSLPGDHFGDLPDRGDLEHELLAAAQDQVRRHQHHILELGRTSALQRLAAFLLALRSHQQTPADSFAIPMGRAEIADYLILQIETVSRCFAKLVALGAIDLPRPTQVQLVDRQRLERLADGRDS